jgi:tungstate transport system ATP-binding protein
VFVTHDRDEAFMFGDRIAVLIGGKLLQTGPTTEVFAHPENLEVAQFIGFDTRIPGVVESASEQSAQVRFNGGYAQVVGDFQAGEELFLCLRPEDIAVSLPGVEGPKSSACNQLRGKALKVTPWGAHYRVALSCGENRLVAFITRPAFLELRIAEGDEVVASFNASAVHVIKRS